MADLPERTNPPYAADELTLLRGFLDYHRATLLRKTHGLTQAQLATAHPPSTLTLAGLVKHLAYVEDWWFGVNLAGAPPSAPFDDDAAWEADHDWEMSSAVDDTPDELHALWRRMVAASERHLEAADGLDAVTVRKHPKTGEGLSVRWILLHLIEEYARHNGHADLIREAVDGTTGE